MALISLYDANGQNLKWEIDDAGSLSSGGVPAARVPITDSLGVLGATEADGAFDEIAKYLPVGLGDPGDGAAIPVGRSATIAITTAGVETNTLAIPSFVGQVMAFGGGGGGGTRAITVASAINAAGNTVITLNAAADSLMLHAMVISGALAWRVVHNDGAALS